MTAKERSARTQQAFRRPDNWECTHCTRITPCSCWLYLALLGDRPGASYPGTWMLCSVAVYVKTCKRTKCFKGLFFAGIFFSFCELFFFFFLTHSVFNKRRWGFFWETNSRSEKVQDNQTQNLYETNKWEREECPPPPSLLPPLSHTHTYTRAHAGTHTHARTHARTHTHTHARTHTNAKTHQPMS